MNYLRLMACFRIIIVYLQCKPVYCERHNTLNLFNNFKKLCFVNAKSFSKPFLSIILSIGIGSPLFASNPSTRWKIFPTNLLY